jgi:hypothetical protein
MNFDNTFVAGLWSMSDFPDSFIDSNKNNLLILGPQEYEVRGSWEYLSYDRDPDLKKLVDHLAATNGTIEVVLGSADIDFYKDFKGLPKSTTVHLWDTYWMTASLKQYLQHLPLTSREERVGVLLAQQQVPTHPYIFLNNHAKYHRLLAMNELHVRGILDEQLVSWRNPPGPGVNPDSLPNDFAWDIKPIYLEEMAQPINALYLNDFNQSIPPKIFNDTFVSLVGESTTRTVFFTEKTWMPMFLRRPGLYINAPGSYQKLVDYGFKLYDEIFDYSFDSETDELTRIKLITDNLERVTQGNIKEMYKLVESKVIFNYNKCISMALDTTLIPKVVIEYIDTLKSLPNTGLRPFELNLLQLYDFMVSESAHLDEYLIK